MFKVNYPRCYNDSKNAQAELYSAPHKALQNQAFAATRNKPIQVLTFF